MSKMDDAPILTVEARIEALRAAAAVVDGGSDVSVVVDWNGEGWSATASGRHLHSVYGSGATLDEALAGLRRVLRPMLADLRRRREAELARVDAAIAGLGGGQ